MKPFYIFIVFFNIISFSTNSQTLSIDEEKFVTIGGIEQWVTIHGDNNSKPIILFLHGGPGSTMSQYNDTIFEKWKKDFILVHWDQRGAGRTFGRNIPADYNEDYWIENPLTVAQMTDDGLELSEYLLTSLGKQKIILLGTSWGSILGAKMALKRPELFYAYLGHSQVVNPLENLKSTYHKMIELAAKSNDDESIEKLESLGVPPYDNAKDAGQLFRIIKKYERKNSIPAPEAWWQLSKDYDNETDIKNREDGDDYSFINFVGHTQLGITAMNATVDFLKDGLKFEIPIFIIQGEEDILTPKEITKAYFDKINAPEKEFFLIVGAAHEYNQSIVETQYKVLKETISPLIKE